MTTEPSSSIPKGYKEAHKAAKPFHIDPADIPLELERLFPPDKVREIARETKFVERERILEPVFFLWTLILGFGVRLERTLSNLRRLYMAWSKSEVCASAWYDRFTPEAVRFLQSCAVLGISQMAGETQRKLADKLRRFLDLLIVDNTIIRLHEALAKRWPATRSRNVAAGLKLSLIVSAVANGPSHVAVHAERTPDIKTLRLGSWVKDRILLMDLGFYKFRIFARIDEQGGYFVSRLKANCNPFILQSLKVHRGQAINLAGKWWGEVESRLQREVADVLAEITFSRRPYNGKSSSDSLPLRLVAIYDDEDKEYHLYLTNIPPEVLSAEDIAALYALRWEIELVFKELKSKYALDVVDTRNPNIVLGLIWTAVLTLLVSRRLYGLLLRSAPREIVGRYTPLRWSNSFAETGEILRGVILGHLGVQGKRDDDAVTLAWSYEVNTLDPNVKRHRLRDGWYA
jgi:IS4 transposase